MTFYELLKLAAGAGAGGNLTNRDKMQAAAIRAAADRRKQAAGDADNQTKPAADAVKLDQIGRAAG